MAIRQLAPDAMGIWLFGLRLDGEARGGVVDNLVEFAHAIDRPTLLVAQRSVQASGVSGDAPVE